MVTNISKNKHYVKWHCPLKKENYKDCWDCKYSKEGLCDYPHVIDNRDNTYKNATR